MEAGEQRREQENGPRPERPGQRVKRVALPSGKTIEVVYFEDGARHESVPARLELHLCPDCDATLVYPVHWTEVDRATWEVTLRCPNCEWIHTGVFDQETVERFDEELDRATDSLVDDLKRLVHANMEEDIERFAHALARDFILPEDF